MNHQSVITFINIYNKWQRSIKIWIKLQSHVEKKFSNKLKKEFNKKHPRHGRRKLDNKIIEIHDQELYREIRSRFQDYADYLTAKWRNHLDSLEKSVKELGANAIISTSDDVWSKYATCSSYCYSTQTNPAYYAKKHAEIDAIDLESMGFSVYIKYIHIPDNGGGWSVPHADYEIWINTTPETALCLKYKPAMNLIEYVAACWRKGVNPRVTMPMLPHGFEEKHGIDYYGNRYATKTVK